MAVIARRGGIVGVMLNFIGGFAFVHTGAAGWLWERVERDVSWRTGPTWDRTLAFLAIHWCAWFAMNAVTLIIRERIPRLRSADAALRRGVAQHATACAAQPRDLLVTATLSLITSCTLVVLQVLLPATWFPVTLATLLVATLVNTYLVRERLSRAITAWAWSGAGVALATLLIHPYFVGLPLFVVRLAVVMAPWDWLGGRLGVSPRLTRWVPSLYSCGSGCTAPQARVAR